MFDKQTIEVPCSNCGRKTTKSVGWLKTNKQFTCGCGTVINLNSDDLLRKINEVERSLGKLVK